MKPIFLYEMERRAGEKLFPSDWIGDLSKEEQALIAGPYGVKRSVTPTKYDVFPSEIAPCPRAIVDELDRALGRFVRRSAQLNTVDTWLAVHGAEIDPKKPHDRKSFNAVLRRAFSDKTKNAPLKRGPKPKVGPQLLDAIQADIDSGKLTIDQLRKLTPKQVQARYGAKPSSMRTALAQFIAPYDAAQKTIPKIPKKNK